MLQGQGRPLVASIYACNAYCRAAASVLAAGPAGACCVLLRRRRRRKRRQYAPGTALCLEGILHCDCVRALQLDLLVAAAAVAAAAAAAEAAAAEAPAIYTAYHSTPGMHTAWQLRLFPAA